MDSALFARGFFGVHLHQFLLLLDSLALLGFLFAIDTLGRRGNNFEAFLWNQAMANLANAVGAFANALQGIFNVDQVFAFALGEFQVVYPFMAVIGAVTDRV